MFLSVRYGKRFVFYLFSITDSFSFDWYFSLLTNSKLNVIPYICFQTSALCFVKLKLSNFIFTISDTVTKNTSKVRKSFCLSNDGFQYSNMSGYIFQHCTCQLHALGFCCLRLCVQTVYFPLCHIWYHVEFAGHFHQLLFCTFKHFIFLCILVFDCCRTFFLSFILPLVD